MLFEDHQISSIFPACFTTPSFTLFQVPSSDRHQLDGTPGSKKPDSDGEGPALKSSPTVKSLFVANRDEGKADSSLTGNPRLTYSKPLD